MGAIWNRGIIGPIFFDETVNQVRYKTTLESSFIPHLMAKAFPMETQWFMQDGAPPHTANTVLDYLHEMFDLSVMSHRHGADKNSIKHTTMTVLLFQTIAPGIPLPPQPVLTRWKTWLDAVNYYADHYGEIMQQHCRASTDYRRKECESNTAIRKSGRKERSRDNLNDIQEYSRKRNDIDRGKSFEVDAESGTLTVAQFCHDLFSSQALRTQLFRSDFLYKG
ncbi:hypothetical protein ANN_10984 [Periplaneta americana]|uniref:Tc1-like transposase DDE domain-containing protein n=1 Tax=Periplaneta americana TaxID=6978 RepID=A0ABQ8T3S3_PERAM|nr:hypothetical protein ANN_10984 [Periplaneta americana]